MIFTIVAIQLLPGRAVFASSEKLPMLAFIPGVHPEPQSTQNGAIAKKGDAKVLYKEKRTSAC